MAKQKEIKFQDRHGDLRGRQNGMEFWIRKGEPQTKSGEKRYFVAIYPVSNNPRQISTLSRQDFDLAGAKEFCQKIAAGEIKVEDVLAEFTAEDDAKERAAIRDVTERAKKFHARLDAMGLKYRDLAGDHAGLFGGRRDCGGGGSGGEAGGDMGRYVRNRGGGGGGPAGVLLLCGVSPGRTPGADIQAGTGQPLPSHKEKADPQEIRKVDHGLVWGGVGVNVQTESQQNQPLQAGGQI